jgi:hypothetical protein
LKREALKTLLYALAFVAVLAGISKITTSKTRTEQTETQIQKPRERFKEYVVIGEVGSARILDSPPDGKTIGRISAGKKVEIFGKRECRTGRFKQIWYKVRSNNQAGWISQYTTTGDIIKEPIGKGKTITERVPHADSPAIAGFDQAAKNNFQEWTMKNCAVTDFYYASDWQIWIRLSPYKYTNKENVEQIARYIAKAYKSQTGYDDLVIVTVWDPYTDGIYAKGYMK